MYYTEIKKCCPRCRQITWNGCSMIICKNASHQQILKPHFNDWGYEVDPWSPDLLGQIKEEHLLKKKEIKKKQKIKNLQLKCVRFAEQVKIAVPVLTQRKINYFKLKCVNLKRRSKIKIPLVICWFATGTTFFIYSLVRSSNPIPSPPFDMTTAVPSDSKIGTCNEIFFSICCNK